MQKTIQILILAAALLILAAVFVLLSPFKNTPVVEAPGETGDGDGQTQTIDEKYCNGFSPESCPDGCAVCPPCEICSSIQCRLEASCAAIGFDKDWYHGNVVIDETPPLPDNGGGQGEGVGMANPASVYCVDQGGKPEIREGEGGQYGMCVFADGRQCDEWGFFRSGVCGDPSDGGGANVDGVVCGRENCHGLDIKCGPNPAEICTMEYRLGDKCLRLASCGVKDGVCQQISSAAFDACKTCVQKCETDFANDPQGAFACEAQCE